MCNCGNKNSAKSYVYQAPNGSSKTFKTEVEAKAEVIKHGGSYRVA